jgi:hypothetical protein
MRVLEIIKIKDFQKLMCSYLQFIDILKLPIAKSFVPFVVK